MTHKYFSIPVEVRGVTSDAEFVTVPSHIDFNTILEPLGEKGVVDERTIRLFRIEPDGSETEEPVQFSPDIQPRHPERHLHPSTPSSVSWAGDWAAEKTPSALRVAGNLTWIARGSQDGVCRYKLVFGVPTEGINVQVPFPPNNLRYFDGNGQPTPVRWFPLMQIRPQWPLDGVAHILHDGDILKDEIYLRESRQLTFYATIKKSLKTVLRKAGLEGVTLHTCRHTFASQLCMAGVPLREVQELMGHASYETTLQYAHLSKDHIKKQVLKLPFAGE